MNVYIVIYVHYLQFDGFIYKNRTRKNEIGRS